MQQHMCGVGDGSVWAALCSNILWRALEHEPLRATRRRQVRCYKFSLDSSLLKFTVQHMH